MPPSQTHHAEARAHLDTLTKPLGSLGRLEDLAAQIIAIHQGVPPLPLSKAIYVFAADHGITAEPVSAYPRAVTHQMVLNFLAGGAAINVLARLHHVALTVVDMGVDADLPEHPQLRRHKLARGTANMLHSPALTPEQLEAALQIGADLAAEAAAKGHTVVALGEMGIGNTTAASAITCALTGAPPSQATGRGTGLTDQAHAQKIAIIEQILGAPKPALSLPKGLDSETWVPTPHNILQYFGGFEIAAITGFALATPRHKLVLVADGFIATAALALAVAIDPDVQPYLIAGHQSQEPGHKILLDYLHLKPLLQLDLRLGEGTGAVLAMPLLDAALALYTGMATFASANVSEAP